MIIKIKNYALSHEVIVLVDGKKFVPDRNGNFEITADDASGQVYGNYLNPSIPEPMVYEAVSSLYPSHR